MSSVRQDAWNQDEDLLLAEVVLRHIRAGSTQLKAFEEVGKRLSRTSAACGFRWNSFVRKQYESAIEFAKKQRKEDKQKAKIEDVSVEQLKKDEKEKKSTEDGEVNLTLDKVINYLQEFKSMEQELNIVSNQRNQLKEECESLITENKRLQLDLKELNVKYKQIEEDYKALIKIMDRARRMVILNEEDEDRQVKFQMDKNGNLERVEK